MKIEVYLSFNMEFNNNLMEIKINLPKNYGNNADFKGNKLLNSSNTALQVKGI